METETGDWRLESPGKLELYATYYSIIHSSVPPPVRAVPGSPNKLPNISGHPLVPFESMDKERNQRR